MTSAVPDVESRAEAVLAALDEEQREGIDFAEVDIEHDATAAELVMQANGGNRTVPTLLFRDGTALTNPSIDQVKSQLDQLPEE